jgi:hypothetical protein
MSLFYNYRTLIKQEQRIHKMKNRKYDLHDTQNTVGARIELEMRRISIK